MRLIVVCEVFGVAGELPLLQVRQKSESWPWRRFSGVLNEVTSTSSILPVLANEGFSQNSYGCAGHVLEHLVPALVNLAGNALDKFGVILGQLQSILCVSAHLELYWNPFL